MTTDLDLDAIRARVDAATPGPWERNAYHVFMDGREQVRIAPLGRPAIFMATMCGADARFIADARTDVPALLAEVERLRAMIEVGSKRGAVASHEEHREAPSNP